MNNRNGMILGLLTATAVALAGCGGSGSSDMANATGFLSLSVSDGPVDEAEKVCIEFNEIEIKGEGPSETIELNDPDADGYVPTRVNLLDFQGANAAPILTSHQLPAGDYQWIRLGIDAERDGMGGTGETGEEGCNGEGSYIVIDGKAHNLYVPSSANNGLKLVGGITVPANQSVNLTAEFDLRKSITAPPGLDPDVIMRPTIRLVNDFEVGTLTGQVANDLATADGCNPWVYLFDVDVPPNGIVDGEEDENDPIATAMVKGQPEDAPVEYHYTIGFLLAGQYDVAFTCDDLDFVAPDEGNPVTIEVGKLTTANFGIAAPQ